MTLILGINSYHADASACLLRDGRVVAAVEEERFRRIKHWAGFPSLSIAYCLKEAGARLSDVDFVALNRDGRAARWRKLWFVLQHRPTPSHLLNRLKNRAKWQGLEEKLAEVFPGNPFKGSVVPIEHQESHLASAFFCSPFDSAAVLSVDGGGDFSTAAWGLGKGQQLSVLGRRHWPQSLGLFYTAATQFLGFDRYGDEYKIMGLAPYGSPALIEKLRPLIDTQHTKGFALDLSYLKSDARYEWNGGEPVVGQLWTPAWENLIGPARKANEPLEQRHRDIAFAVQALFEEAYFHLLGELHKKSGEKQVALAGGCAFNSAANGKIRRRTPFTKVYVQSAGGDAGGALGAALAQWHRIEPDAPRQPLLTAALGPAFSDDDIATVLNDAHGQIAEAGCKIERVHNEAELVERVARAIAAGAVVGWFQGRMEWGPRALGQRSILCDPRRADMKELLNAKIKRRESFRPFAPSILREAVREWFEEEDEVPFMMQVFQFRPEKRAQIPAVVHVDGSGRLQTVSQVAQPLYHALISRFGELTGVPMVLNTSFNENEPVVCRPEEALSCFLRTRMDFLALGSFAIER